MWINMHRFWYQVCATFSTLHWAIAALARSLLHPRSTFTPSWPDHGITLTTNHLTPPLASAPPFHSHFTAYRFLGLFTSFSASFFSVGGDRGRQEAVEKWQGKAQRKRGKAQVDRYQWDKHWHIKKSNESRHFSVVIPTRNQHQNPHNWIVKTIHFTLPAKQNAWDHPLPFKVRPPILDHV